MPNSTLCTKSEKGDLRGVGFAVREKKIDLVNRIDNYSSKI